MMEGNIRHNTTAPTAAAAVGLVDVIFLDIDGVLLPFGGDGDHDGGTAPGCIFPDRTMDALTSLIDRAGRLLLEAAAAGEPARGNPALVLSSTWRVRADFVDDIVSSLTRHAARRRGPVGDGGGRDWTTAWPSPGSPDGGPFFDMTDPLHQSTRCDEVYKWVSANAGLVHRTDGGGTTRTFRVRSWIALDDEDLVNVEGRTVGDAVRHAVRTESSVGLTEDDVDVAMGLIEAQIRDFHRRPAGTRDGELRVEG